MRMGFSAKLIVFAPTAMNNDVLVSRKPCDCGRRLSNERIPSYIDVGELAPAHDCNRVEYIAASSL